MSGTVTSVGIDVSKGYLDAYDLPLGRAKRFANTIEGVAELMGWLEEYAAERPLDRIVCEASGGYERLLVGTLQKAGLPVAQVNARQVRDFARAKGILAKTDCLDARVLAEFAVVMRPPVTPAHPCAELSEYVARRRQLVDLLRRERQHASISTAAIQAEIGEHIGQLEAHLKACEIHIRELIAADAELARKQAVLTSCKGIGEATAATLLVQLPELGDLSPAKVAALAGLAPFNQDSGSQRGSRHIRGGRGEVRTALYMATLSAKRYNPDIKVLYERLTARGKHAKVALTACARQLLLTLNALLRDDRSWTPSYRPQAG